MALIASNIMENIKTRSYDDIEKYLDELSYVGITKKIENNIQYVTIYGNEFSEKFFGTSIPEDYIIEFQVENNVDGFNIQKKINIYMYYNKAKKLDVFEISTIIERENINECNMPILSDEYFNDFGFSEEEYEFIPIKYSKEREDIKAFVTAGSTGAALTAGILRLGRIKGVMRPALAPILPTLTGGNVCLIDCGANMDSKPEYLVQFAVMGTLYMQTVYGIEKPRVALLSVGVGGVYCRDASLHSVGCGLRFNSTCGWNKKSASSDECLSFRHSSYLWYPI